MAASCVTKTRDSNRASGERPCARTSTTSASCSVMSLCVIPTRSATRGCSSTSRRSTATPRQFRELVPPDDLVVVQLGEEVPAGRRLRVLVEITLEPVGGGGGQPLLSVDERDTPGD